MIPPAMVNEKSPRDMLLGGLIFRRVRVRAREVVFVKGVIEASEGLAVVFAESGGDLTIATLPASSASSTKSCAIWKHEHGVIVQSGDDLTMPNRRGSHLTTGTRVA